MMPETKTIGAFIATLRKASGMTQKELAERLNVSDKTVSRWENDDGAPDLRLIPVIAELFGVTCDELLRGERKPLAQQTQQPYEPTEPTAKAEKALKRIVREASMTFRTRSMISLGIACVGFIAALAANSFNRANLGFLLCWAFQLIAAVCEGAFLNRALFAISADDLTSSDVDAARRSMIALASRCFCVMFMIALAVLPMLLLVPDSCYGLTGDAWFLLATVLSVAAWLIWALVNDEVTARLLQRGLIRMSPRETEKFTHNHTVKRRVAVGLAAALLLTMAAHAFMMNFASAYQMAKPIVFNDYESFKAFVEDDGEHFSAAEIAVEPVEVPSENAFSRQLTLKDGTVALSYQHLNDDVIRVTHTEHDGSLLPISVLTHTAVREAQNWVAIRNAAFCAAYALEVTAAVIFYRTKRAK